jgi:DNA-binding FadR family transcriptional regulator
MAETQTEQVSVGLYNDILAGILMGDYPLQTRLPTETRLAKDYGVSRTVVRSALELLKSEGVVQSRQGSGTVVVEIDPATIARLNRDAQLPTLKDCYACRLAIEPAIGSTVAQDLSQEACAFLEEQRRVLDSNEEGDEYERSARDAQFHIQLAEFSGNTFFISVMNTLRPHMLFAMNISKTLTNCAHQRHVNLSRQEHLSIISAILKRDPVAAQDAMLSHIKKGTERIFQDSPGFIDVG